MKYNLLTVLLLNAVAAALAPSAFATTWYVNGVTGNDNNSCMAPTTACKTIGHAISLAASGDTVRVAAATYVETIVIGINLKILGSGAASTIIDAAGGTGPIVAIKSTAHVTISGLTMRNAQAHLFAGGIWNDGTLRLLNSAVTGNTSGIGRFCYKSPCINKGAGILNDGGTLTISNSTVSANVVNLNCPSKDGDCNVSGGGIYNLGKLRIINSTVSGNAANFTGFGVSGGGGISSAGTVVMSNATIAVNTAITSGGGVGSAPIAKMTLQNTIISNNSGGNCDGSMQSSGYNLSSDSTCALSGLGDMNNTDPKLGPLGDNGGQTQTMALPSGSPAVDAGNPNGCTDGLGHLLKKDQRGMPRPDSEDTGGCDIGAYERQSD